ALLRISDDRGHRVVSSEVPGLRPESGEGAAVAEQGAVQQALRGCRRASLRERGGAPGSQTVWLSREHRPRHRSAVCGAVGGDAAETGAAADGRGRNPSWEEAEVPDGGVQSADRRAAVVWTGPQEGNLGRVLREGTECVSTQGRRGCLRGHVGAL